LHFHRRSGICGWTCSAACQLADVPWPCLHQRAGLVLVPNYGFSDGADLFVFISGYTSALVFGRRMIEGGFVFGTTRLLRRVWQIYAAHILLFVFYLASVHLLSNSFNAPGLVDRFNVAPC
jgi:hypothetical protein